MPLYEYECGNCRKTFEVVQKFSDPPLVECTLCQGGPLAKLLSRTSFHLKGSGWYATDYKKTSAAPAKEAAPEKKVEKTSGSKGGEKPPSS